MKKLSHFLPHYQIHPIESGTSFFCKTCVLFCLLFAISCNSNDDFEIPALEIAEPDIDANTSLFVIKNILDQSGKELYTFPTEDLSIVEAYVISSDEAGNFYKVLIIQDQPENPGAGISVLIDQKKYHSKFNFGRKIYVKLAGLSIQNRNGNYTLGILNRNELTHIPESLIDLFILRSSASEVIVPLEKNLNEIGENQINTYLKINNLQFSKDELGKTFAGEDFDLYQGERTLIQCNNLNTTTLSTSIYANFKSFLIPEEKGEIHAVFQKDFYGEKNIFVLNNPGGINFTVSERCDPNFYFCENPLEGSKDRLFFEDFENIKNNGELEDLGWVFENVNYGKEHWKRKLLDENTFMRISAYETKENPLEAWLISPPIDLDHSENEELSFETKASYDNGLLLTVWISTDFSESIQHAHWEQLDVAISVGPKNANNPDFTNSGKVNLHCLSGKVRIGFKYLGADPNQTTTYDLDQVLITKQ